MTRRKFLRERAAVGAGLVAWGAGRLLGGDARARLAFRSATLPDPDGHREALRLKGDWMIVGISDGKHTGVGEVSHSGDDAACLRRAGGGFWTRVAPRASGMSL